MVPATASAVPRSPSAAAEIEPTWSELDGHAPAHPASGWPPVVTGENNTYGRKNRARPTRSTAMTARPCQCFRRPVGNDRSA